MDAGSAIIGAILLLMAIVPIVMLNHTRMKRDRLSLKILQDSAQNINCKISQHDLGGDFGIGMDEEKNVVFFFKRKEDEVNLQHVDLSKIDSCQAVKQTRTIVYKKTADTITDRIELTLTPKRKDQSDIRFVLFDGETDPQIIGELQMVDKWSSLISNRLKRKK